MNSAIGIALTRFSLGAILFAHGFILKVQTFTLAGWVGYAESLGIPAIVAYLVAYGEILGGIALMVGVLSRLAAWLSLPILIGAAYAHIGNGWLFSAENGGWEFPVLLVVMAVSVGLSGAGAFALENTSAYRKLLNRESDAQPAAA